MRTIKKLWAPWRYRYIEDLYKLNENRCIFCIDRNEEPSEENLILYKSKHSFLIMNYFPYNCGHLMVAPYKHVSSLEQLSSEELSDTMSLIAFSLKLLKKTLKPEGFNVGMNIGKAAGAGVEGHVHVHVVPRWVGDTNFMPLIGGTKVIPQLVTETYRRIRNEIENYFSV